MTCPPQTSLVLVVFCILHSPSSPLSLFFILFLEFCYPHRMAQTTQKKVKRKPGHNSDEHDSSPPAKRAKTGTARKSTGGRPPKARVSAVSDRDEDRGEGPSRRASCSVLSLGKQKEF